MKIKSIELENFRQFFGANCLKFSISESQGISIIHGENGAGKTSILNAFKWGLYGKTDFDTGEENILNERAIAEAADGSELSVTVSIEFEHENKQYTLKRRAAYNKISGMDTDTIGGHVVELSWMDPEGNYQTSNNPNNHINQILPEDMHSYFFFNGERIEKLANASSAYQVRDAIKTLMGLEIVDRAKSHLSGGVIKSFRKELKAHSQKELGGLVDQENAIADEIDKKEASLKERESFIEQAREEISEINKRFKVVSGAAALQAERDALEVELKKIKEQTSKNALESMQLISKRGFTAFFDKVARDVSELLEERREKGELPYKIKTQLIDDLLAEAVCICERPLIKGEQAYAAVEGYRTSTAAFGVEEAFISTAGDLKQIPMSRDEFFRQLRDLSESKSELNSTREKNIERLDEISSSLQRSDVEDIKSLEARRKKIDGDMAEALGDKGALTFRIEELRKEKVVLDKQIAEASDKSKSAQMAQKKMYIAEECSRVLSELHEALAHRTRESLSSKVNETLQSIMRKEYWAEIDEDYSLQLFKDIPGHGSQPVVDKSTGESQVTSLSFIGSIINLLRERETEEDKFFRGGIYPIVMDSPFGTLDEEYRGLVARYVPKLANQVIVLVSGSQWKGTVSEECAPRIGAEISLIYHSPDIEEDEVSTFKRRTKDYEFTTIEEGYNG
jgi:DNA sulfur modification protein DndD